MDLNTYCTFSQRFDRLENSLNLLQIQLNTLQSCIEEYFPEIVNDLEAIYAAKVEAYNNSREKFPGFDAAPLTPDQNDPSA